MNFINFLMKVRPYIQSGKASFDEVVNLYRKYFKKEPEGMEVIGIRKEFSKAAEGEKVLEFPQKRTFKEEIDVMQANKPLTEEEIIAKYKKMNEQSVANLKAKKEGILASKQIDIDPKRKQALRDEYVEKLIEMENKTGKPYAEDQYSFSEFLKEKGLPSDLDYATGGRVGYKVGSLVGLGKLAMNLFKKGKDADELAKQEKIFREGPIDVKFLENIDKKFLEPFIRTRDMGGSGGYGLYKSFEEMPAGLKAAELISRIRKSDGGIDYASAEAFIGKKLKGNETIDELIEMVASPQVIEKATGGRVGYQVGGPATPEQFAAALARSGAGSEADKRRSLGNYLGDYIATQGQKLGNAAVIPLQAAKGVLGIEGTPMTSSMQSALQNIIQNQIKNTGQLSGNINYKDYGVQTSTGAEFEGFGNRSITDPEAALATTLGRASYTVDPTTGKVNFTGGTAYDFRDDQFGGLGKFISKGGVFGSKPTEYKPEISLGSEFLKPYQQATSSNQSNYPDYKTAALQSQFYKNNPSHLDFDLFRAAYANPQYNKVNITNDGQIVTDFGNWDPSRTYSAYMSNTQTSSDRPFWEGVGWQGWEADRDRIAAMYGAPGNLKPYYAKGGSVDDTMGMASLFTRRV